MTTPAEPMSAFKPGDVVEIIQVGAVCDGCGTTEEHDYLVREDSTEADRFEVARAHLRREGWMCDIVSVHADTVAAALAELFVKRTEPGQ